MASLDSFNSDANSLKSFKLIDDCYIFIYHLGPNAKGDYGEFVLLPSVPDDVTDSMQTTFSSTNALSRSAPIYSFSNAGPRSIRIQLKLHRDMMKQINYNKSNMTLELGDDYVDTLIKKIQSISLPNYNASTNSVVAPMIAVRLGNEVFIKGVVDSSLSVTYEKPLLANGKYAVVTLAFNVSEVDPYDANTVAEKGSFRGLTKTNMLELYKGV